MPRASPRLGEAREGLLGTRHGGGVRGSGTFEVIGKANRVINSSKITQQSEVPEGSSKQQSLDRGGTCTGVQWAGPRAGLRGHPGPQSLPQQA